MENSRIYVILGGGQRIRQNIHYKRPITYTVIENSDWPVKAKCHGVDSYANAMWSVDLDTLQRWANEWVGKKVEITESKEE